MPGRYAPLGSQIPDSRTLRNNVNDTRNLGRVGKAVTPRRLGVMLRRLVSKSF